MADDRACFTCRVAVTIPCRRRRHGRQRTRSARACEIARAACCDWSGRRKRAAGQGARPVSHAAGCRPRRKRGAARRPDAGSRRIGDGGGGGAPVTSHDARTPQAVALRLGCASSLSPARARERRRRRRATDAPQRHPRNHPPVGRQEAEEPGFRIHAQGWMRRADASSRQEFCNPRARSRSKPQEFRSNVNCPAWIPDRRD
jgi:hypothetical protein